MLPADYPAYPPLVYIILMVLAQFLFGLAYNWAYRKLHLPDWAGVVGGVAATGFILYGFFWSYMFRGEQWLFLTTLAFASSGTPMAIGSILHHEKLSHRRRPLPNWALRSRDDAVMETSELIRLINRTVENGQINATFLVRMVNSLHEIIGILKG